jgi:ERO1-like protein beta
MESSKPFGLIPDASCQIETIDQVHSKLHPILQNLTKTTFFKYFKVNLYRKCPFWDEPGLCNNQACSVEISDHVLFFCFDQNF